MEEKEKYERAKKRVEEIKGFYIHLFMYVVINIAIAIINFIVSPDHLWFYWSLIGWGIGIAAHGFSVFGFGRRFLGQEWEEKKIRDIMKNQHKE